MRKILEIAHKVPVRDVLDAIHPNAIDVKISRPAREIGKHQLASRSDRLNHTRDRVIGNDKLRVPEQGTSKTVTHCFYAEPASRS